MIQIGIYNSECIYVKSGNDDILIPVDQIPHLISRLIELGGGSKWPDIPRHIPNDEAAAWIVQNYHLIPKADKK